jgi:hypothetical protein
MSEKFISNNVYNYISDGFKKVCDVYHEYSDDNYGWQLYNIDDALLWSTHNSWIYFIVSGIDIMKVGETSQPLGIKSTNCLLVGEVSIGTDYLYSSVQWPQPIPKSTNRFGRLCTHNYGKDDTDWFIRTSLHNDVMQEKVSLWAKKCPLVQVPVNIGWTKATVNAAIQKDLELLYIDAINPPLNKGRK